MGPATAATDPPITITVRQAALVAGVGLLIMVVAAPVAEQRVYPSLVVPGRPPSIVPE